MYQNQLQEMTIAYQTRKQQLDQAYSGALLQARQYEVNQKMQMQFAKAQKDQADAYRKAQDSSAKLGGKNKA